jgi:nitrate reductase NapAB chaperone NapD
MAIIRNKTVKKVNKKSKKVDNIYVQLNILSPSEIEFLQTSLVGTIEYTEDIINSQKKHLKNLQSLQNNSLIYKTEDSEDKLNSEIDELVSAISYNSDKLIVINTITNKFKQFEGII